MAFDIGEKVKALMQARKGGERSMHMWLEGFSQIIQGDSLSHEKVLGFSAVKTGDFPPFTPLTSGSLLNKYSDLVMQGKFYMLRLPFDDSYHLQFPLVRNDSCEFLYETCNDCEATGPHGLPIIELRMSIELPEEQFGEIMLYDNRRSPDHIDKDILYKGYEAMQEFIDITRV